MDSGVLDRQKGTWVTGPLPWQAGILRTTEGKGGVQERQSLADWVLVFRERNLSEQSKALGGQGSVCD